MEALYDEQTWKEDRYSFFQLDKQYLKEVTGTFCDGDIQTLFEKNAEKRQALAEALRKDILENGGQTVKDQPCAMLMFDYTGIPSEGYMDEGGMNVPAVQEGERVLLHAAAGGVGLLALQILKRRFRSVEVVGIASTEEKLDLLRAEGCDHVINRSTQDYVAEVLKIWGPKATGFQTGGALAGGVDVSFNGVSGDTLSTDWQVIRKRGRWVIYGYAAGRGRLDTAPFGYDGITVMPFSSIAWQGTADFHAGSEFIRDWLDREPLIDPVIHPVEDVVEVQRSFETGGTTGKVVFRI